MSAERPRILLSAGEPSGDLHGATLAEELKRRWPEAELYGFGGDRMQAAGVRLWAHADEMAVMGFVEVARHLPFLLRLLRETRHDLRARPPDLVIPIDYPGFNLRLARYAKGLHIPVLYYIAPQVWAWHRSRMKELAHNADRLAVVLPFEEQLFRDAGAAVTFVGHPLLDASTTSKSREAFCAEHGLAAQRPILALLPGSRMQEIRHHAALFAQAASLVQQQQPEVQPVIAQAPGIADSAFAGTRWPRVQESSELLQFAHAALTKSGTSTLECALALTPMVIAYRMNPISFLIARNVVEVEHIGLVNLIAGERVAPEFIQDDARPEALATALLAITRAGPEREAQLAGLRGVRQKLTGDARGAAAKVAELAAEILHAP
jgi:lipid-A-disaccharide synthase